MKLRFGTSSWGWKEWVGPFYPEGTKPTNYLRVYSEHFDTVETDSTYYGIPKPDMVKGWVDKTPDGFRMAAKFPRSIVHAGAKGTPDPHRLLDLTFAAADRDEFLAAMLHLGAKAGPLVLQFPYFGRRVFSHAKPFFERLDLFLASLPPNFRYAVEVRNKGFLRPDLLEILRKHDTALVLTDYAWMPHADELPKRLDPITTDFTYIRLIGDRKEIEAITRTWEREVLDRSDRMERWARLVRSFEGKVPETWAFANNHYAGHGPATIRRFREMVEADGPTLPDAPW